MDKVVGTLLVTIKALVDAFRDIGSGRNYCAQLLVLGEDEFMQLRRVRRETVTQTLQAAFRYHGYKPGCLKKHSGQLGLVGYNIDPRIKPRNIERTKMGYMPLPPVERSEVVDIVQSMQPTPKEV